MSGVDYADLTLVMPWWRHQMETFSVLLGLCAGNSLVSSEFPSRRPVTWSFDVFFDLSGWNGWVNNCEAGDLRCHHAHYDIIVMAKLSMFWTMLSLMELASASCNLTEKKWFLWWSHQTDKRATLWHLLRWSEYEWGCNRFDQWILQPLMFHQTPQYTQGVWCVIWNQLSILWQMFLYI